MPAETPVDDRRRGTPAAALRVRDFRVVWLGSLGSSVGTWMQNAVLGAFGWHLTHSYAFVALLGYLQMVPQFFLAVLCGVFADRHSRKWIVLWASVAQGVATLALTVVAASDQPSRPLMLASVSVLGVANSFYLTAWGALLPGLVPREDLPGAVSLGFVQLNLSRVLGPFVGLWIYRVWGAPWVFGFNAASYVLMIIALSMVRPVQSIVTGGAGTIERAREGINQVLHSPHMRWVMGVIGGISVFSLSFISLMPAIADERYGMGEKSAAYQWLYAAFAAGAALSAVVVGTFLGRGVLEPKVRYGLVGFATALVAAGMIHSKVLAYPVMFAVGFGYFFTVTCLSTSLQKRLTDENRGRVLAIWFMAFGGMIPWGTQLMSWVAEWTSLGVVLVLSGLAAALLAVWTHTRLPEVTSAPAPVRA